jgi:hypothetical protein
MRPSRLLSFARLLDGLFVTATAATLLASLTPSVSFELLGLAIHHPARPAALALVLALARAVMARRAADATPSPLPGLALHAVSLAAVGYWLAHLTAVAGGADSYGYVSAAGLLRRGTLSQQQPDADWLPVPSAIDLLAPFGYAPAPGAEAASIVPTYPLGFPALMALASVVSSNAGPYLVAPAAGLVLLLLVHRLARRWHPSPLAAALAVALVAWNPVVVAYASQPMSDVPATAWLLLALSLLVGERRRPGLAGLAAGASFLTRPGGVGAIAAVGLVSWWTSSTPRRAAAAWAAGCAPCIVLQAGLQWALFGSPIRTGYGDLGYLYAGGSAWDNVSIYVAGVLSARSLLWLLAVALGFVLGSRRAGAIAGTVTLLGVVPYLLYLRFDHWETLRFVLPGIVLLDVVAAFGVFALAARLHRHGPAVLAPAAALAAALHSGGFLRDQGVPDLMERERRYPLVAEWIDRHTPATAMVFAAQHAGSIRHYAGRTTLRWDVLQPGDLYTVVDAMRARSRAVYVALEGDEQEQFRMRFKGSIAETGASATTRPDAVSLVPGAQVRNVQIWELATPSETAR